MANNWDIDVDDEEFEDAPRALRNAYKALKKQFDTAVTERDDFRSKWQTRTAGDALAEFGFRNTKRVTRDLLADGVDISDANAVKAWVGENGDDYAKGEAGPAQTAEQTVDHSEEAAARQQLATAQAGATPANGDRMKAALAEIGPDTTADQVLAIYKKHGI